MPSEKETSKQGSRRSKAVPKSASGSGEEVLHPHDGENVKHSQDQELDPREERDEQEIEESTADKLAEPTEDRIAEARISAATQVAQETAAVQRQAEDRALVRRAREGDQRAFFELAKRHRSGIERLIRPMVRTASTDELEDLVQESLTKAFLHINSYSDEFAFSTWLYRIATNHAIDYLRRKKLNAFSINAPVTQGTSKGEEESREYEISDHSWVPEDLMMADERTRLIEEAIENLPENYRRIIKLRHSDDMDYEEIAKVLNIPMGTVKVHLHRARAALAKMLEGKI